MIYNKECISPKQTELHKFDKIWHESKKGSTYKF